jgi:hypothetical protein
MIKLTRLLLAGAVALALSDVGLAQDNAPKPPGGAHADTTQDNAPGPPGGPYADIMALVDESYAQDALTHPSPGGPGVGVGGGVLEALPRPRDLPASLFAPSPPPSSGFLRVDGPYFVRDWFLDGQKSQPPGWFTGLELQILKPHLIPGLSNVVQPGKIISNSPNSGPPSGSQHIVALPSAPLGWTVSPRVFLGYRLPSGFGEFMVAYRHLGTDGGGIIAGPNGPAALSSRFAFDILDFDYNSSELSLGPQWDMRWAFGLRSLFLFYDSRANQSFGQASAGDGVFQARNFNNLFGFGPHAALELTRHLGESGWSLSARGDFAGTFDWTSQGFSTLSTTLGPHGRPLFGETRAFGHQAAPMITGRAGVAWQPSPSSHSRLFIGYQYEVFWSLVRVSQSSGSPFPVPSLGQFWDQGLVLQASFCF